MRTEPFCFCTVRSLGLRLHREDVIWVGQLLSAQAEDALES